MTFEQIPTKGDSGRKENTDDKTDILKKNINTLIELFELDERNGKYESQQKLADNITRIIQQHTETVENGYNKIGDPKEFIKHIREVRDKAIEETEDEAEKLRIASLFNHVDIPSIEIE